MWTGKGNRRSSLAASLPPDQEPDMTAAPKKHLRLVATEEAFACKEYAVEMRRLLDNSVDDLDLSKLWFWGEPKGEPGSESWNEWWKGVFPGNTPQVGRDDAFF